MKEVEQKKTNKLHAFFEDYEHEFFEYGIPNVLIKRIFLS